MFEELAGCGSLARLTRKLTVAGVVKHKAWSRLHASLWQKLSLPPGTLPLPRATDFLSVSFFLIQIPPHGPLAKYGP